MFLLAAFGLKRRCYNSLQWCYLNCHCTETILLQNKWNKFSHIIKTLKRCSEAMKLIQCKCSNMHIAQRSKMTCYFNQLGLPDSRQQQKAVNNWQLKLNCYDLQQKLHLTKELHMDGEKRKTRLNCSNMRQSCGITACMGMGNTVKLWQLIMQYRLFMNWTVTLVVWPTSWMIKNDLD